MTTQRSNIDSSHSGAHFAVRHMVIAKVRGGFEQLQGTIDFDPSQPEVSNVSVGIEAASIDTHEPKRDEHLRSADFLDLQKYPPITFRSRKVQNRAKDKYSVLGDLTIHGVTLPVELDAPNKTAHRKEVRRQLKRVFARVEMYLCH